MIKRLSRALIAALIAVTFIPITPTSASIASPDTLTISSVNVYRNSIELLDQLYLITGTINYTVNPAGENAYDLFLIRLMDGATELKATAPYAFFDDGFDYFVIGMYFSAAEVTALGIGWGVGTGYSVKIEGNPGADWTASPPPSVVIGTFDQWYDGTTVSNTTVNLTLKMRTLALATENTWGVTLTELLAGVRKFNATGEDYFTTTIPDLRLMTPELFSQSLTTPDFMERDLVNIGYTGGDTTQQVIYGVNWAVETFTATSGFNIAGVYFKYFRTGAPGNITASIRATVAGEPNGADLASGTLSANSAVTSGGEWDSITFTTPVALVSGTVYAVVFRALTGDVANSVSLKMDETGTYTGGQVWTSVNSGAAWSAQAAKDILFTIMGDESHNLTWLQQWEGRLIGTPFDMTNLGNIFGWNRMLMGTIIWFIIALAGAFLVTRKTNSFKSGLPVIGMMMIIGGVFGISYAAIGIAIAILFPVGALYAVLKPSR